MIKGYKYFCENYVQDVEGELICQKRNVLAVCTGSINPAAVLTAGRKQIHPFSA